MKKFSMLNESVKFGHLMIEDDKILYIDDDFFIMYDGFPTSPGHILIITNGTEKDYFELSQGKKNKLSQMLDKAKEIIEGEYNPDGYNIGMNCGVTSGQTVMHFHCHVIPRFKGDVDNPSGGVRHCVMHKGYY